MTMTTIEICRVLEGDPISEDRSNRAIIEQQQAVIKLRYNELTSYGYGFREARLQAKAEWLEGIIQSLTQENLEKQKGAVENESI